MKFEPRPHQALALDFLREHNRAGLFLDMGLGKTVITLTRVKELIDDYAVNKVLVIAPKRVAEDTWSREQDKWDHLHGLRVSKILGTEAQRIRAVNMDADIYVINRENVVWLAEYLGKYWPFDGLVIDELSSFKSPSSKRFRALKRVVKLCNYVIALTGTPAPNGYMDLWPEIYLLDYGERLGQTLGAFRNRYFSPGAHKGHIVFEWRLKSGAKEQIDHRLSDLCLSMSKDDWLNMPPILFNDVVVRMSPGERELYDRIVHDKVLPLLDGKVSSMENFDSAVVGTNAATLSGKLLQCANGAVYDDRGDVVQIHDRKLDALEDIIEAANGKPVLCFYQFQHDLARIRERFPDLAMKLEHGPIGTEQISAWNRGEIPLLLCHPASAGHGLNLQEGGSTVVWFGLPWSLELYEQANARLYRMGQQERVVVHHILCEGTLDRKVLAALHTKDQTQRALLNALKGYINETTI